MASGFSFLGFYFFVFFILQFSLSLLVLFGNALETRTTIHHILFSCAMIPAPLLHPRSLSPGVSVMAVAMKQQTFSALNTHWKYRFCYGGSLRKSLKGRGARPLSSKDPIHLVLKINKVAVHGGLRSSRNFRVVTDTLRKYSFKFFIKIEQVSVQNDHVHLLIRGGKRAQIQNFLRVLSGQMAQRLTDTFAQASENGKVWKYRPFTRVIKGYRPYRIVRDYIQLNECEVNGRPYSKTRLRGFSQEQLQELWI